MNSTTMTYLSLDLALQLLLDTRTLAEFSGILNKRAKLGHCSGRTRVSLAAS